LTLAVSAQTNAIVHERGFMMRIMKLLWAALLALPLLVAALVYGKALRWCHPTDAGSQTAECCDRSECCSSDRSECCQQQDKTDAPKQAEKPRVQGSDPDRQIVFRVEGLACPAVKGIGCGNLLRPVLVSLDQIDGVEASSANYAGSMIRISATPASDRDKVAEAVRKVLADKNHKPTALAGDELQLAVEKEEWRETWRIGELSIIEFRTLVPYRIRAFAKAQKLDNEATDKLVKLAERQWDRIVKEANDEKATQPDAIVARCRKSLPLFLEQLKEVLSDEQVEQFKKTLTTACREEDRPEAPPAGTKREKAP
jgi:hypothetical protein